MIKLLNKEDCCGCNACVQSCPKHCISMEEDNEGFLYPIIKSSNCIDCGICEKVCPELDTFAEIHEPLSIYAAINKNIEIRKGSSSGGLFYAIAEYIISSGGIIFSARFDESWKLIHDCTEEIDSLFKFQGSKYLQSEIGECYKKVKIELLKKRYVLFIGTPCQVRGLKKYIKNDFDNLYTVDFICHGVPSPGVFRKYLDELLDEIKVNKKNIFSIEFRNKRKGWRFFSFKIMYKVSNKIKIFQQTKFNNLYLQGFLKNLYLRPSCYNCKFKNNKSGSDITISDFWNIKSGSFIKDDDYGCSSVFINTKKGECLFSKLRNIQYFESSYKDTYQKSYANSVTRPLASYTFFEDFIKTKKVQFNIKKTLKKRVVNEYVKIIFVGIKNFIKRKLNNQKYECK